MYICIILIMYIYYCKIFPSREEEQIILGKYYIQNNNSKNENQFIVDQLDRNVLQIENIRKSNEQ